MGRFRETILHAEKNLAMPVNVFPGGKLTGFSVQDIVTDAQKQYESQKALHDKYQTAFVMTAMDLSLEAEEFGCEIRFSEDEVPTVIGRLVTDSESVKSLSIPKPGTGRTKVALETARLLSELPSKPVVLGGIIGPFSLAGRLFGVSESLELSMNDPDMLELLIGKATKFLIEYARAFKEAGADGLLMAEPTAGLLSPRMLAMYSSPYIKEIVDAVEDDNFEVVLHNCAAKIFHLKGTLESGARAFHFGAPMDIKAALEQVPEDIIISGNLDPSGVFCNLDKTEMKSTTSEMLEQVHKYKNFLASSGCDIPEHAPVENIDAFYEAVEQA